MRLRFERAFVKDLQRLPGQAREEVKRVLAELREAQQLRMVGSCKKLKGYSNYYRIRIGDYRLGLKDLGDGEIALLRILHRREIYRRFP